MSVCVLIKRTLHDPPFYTLTSKAAVSPTCSGAERGRGRGEKSRKGREREGNMKEGNRGGKKGW